MTKEVLNKLPENLLKAVMRYRHKYMALSDPTLRGSAYAEMIGYLKGLCDAGVITELERRTIFTYITL